METQLNDAQVAVKPAHFVGYGYIEANEETEKMEVANCLCQVYSNAPRGYLRVYVRRGEKWEGPLLVNGELVQITG